MVIPLPYTKHISTISNMENIRNFAIISHIDHGKSTLADRFLEITGTVDKRKMTSQYLDKMELERERGITIKMAPVRMHWSHPELAERPPHPSAKTSDSEQSQNNKAVGKPYILNLIDTPGHSDFSYEVSRALAAVEGAILLVDATQGIQAQTLANLRAAESANLHLIGTLNKVDMNPPGVDELTEELAKLINQSPTEIYKISAKTGEGVAELLQAVIKKVPPPTEENNTTSRALVFDSFYDNHKGVIASVRIFDGSFTANEIAHLIATEAGIKIKELGTFSPELKPTKELATGEIGYIATGLKDPEKVKIGDTITAQKGGKPIGEYKEPNPVVFVSFYPEDADEHDALDTALQKLKLNDSALEVEPDKNDVLGRGFKVGFLGRLHFEITAERIKREFDISTVHTFPSVKYKAQIKGAWRDIINPSELPAEHDAIQEPIVRIELIVPQEYSQNIFKLQQQFRFQGVETEVMQGRVVVRARMPLAELVSDFDDQIKSATKGFASFSYEFEGYKVSDVIKVDFLVAGDPIEGLSRFFHRSVFETEARKMTKRLKELLPRQQFSQAIQATAQGRIIAREDIRALGKNVTGHLYGGDRTRKMKLWKKQQKGKKRLKERANVQVSPEVFKELLKK
jgi:GTP-binding protein LepA